VPVIYREAKAYLESWIENFLDKPHPAFGGYSPCPYAKKSLIDAKVEFIACNAHTFPDKINIKGYDVIVYIFEDEMSAEELTKKAEVFNTQNPSLVALEDHPQEQEAVKDCVLNNGRYATIFIQDRQKLEKFRKNLKKTCYYENWSAEYLDEVINR